MISQILAYGQQLMSRSTPVVVAADQPPIAIKDVPFKVGVEITRPNDTTAYTAKDVVSTSNTTGTLITFTNVAWANNASGFISRARLMTNNKNDTSLYKLHLFHTAPNAIPDNSPYLVEYTNANNRIGVIEFAAMSTESPSSNAAYTMRPNGDGSYGPPNLFFQTDTNSRNLHGMLEINSSYTPVANQKYYIEIAG